MTKERQLEMELVSAKANIRELQQDYKVLQEKFDNLLVDIEKLCNSYAE